MSTNSSRRALRNGTSEIPKFLPGKKMTKIPLSHGFHSDGGLEEPYTTRFEGTEPSDCVPTQEITQFFAKLKWIELYAIRDGDGNEDDVVQGDDDVQRRRWNCGHENEMEENESEVEENEGSLEEIEGDDDLEEIANGAVGENKNEEVEEKAVDEII
ncbi:unnamed protein product [Prunus armeniaca]